MQEVLDVFDRQGLIGIWTAHQESEIVGDPNCSRAGHGNEFSWRLSIPTVKAAFMDSQERISLYLPISHYISLYLPTSPYISLYLPYSAGSDPHHRCSVRGQPDDHSAYEALLDRWAPYP